jgi:hypothetical protein
VLAKRQSTIEPAPEGKLIEAIEIETLKVFEPADPLPGWLNWFHPTSRTAVVERELLTRPGQKYEQGAVDESSRNLRRLKQLSLVLLVPVQSEHPDRVKLLVITKDIWSLRLNSNFRARNGTIEYLILQPSEENLFGSHLTLAGQYAYTRTTDSFGGTLSHQRLFGSPLRALFNFNAIQYRETGRVEGSTGQLYFGRPFYSTRDRWSWGTSLGWTNHVTRLNLPSSTGGYGPRLYRNPETPWLEPVPYRYRGEVMAWQTAVTRSWGSTQKTRLGFGLEALRRRFDAQGLLADGYSRAAVGQFEQKALEHDNVRIGPFAQLYTYRNTHVSMLDFETLGLQEDHQVGPAALLKIYTGAKRAFGTRDLVGIVTGLQHSTSIADSFLRLWVTHATELTPQREERDGLVQGGVHVVSPRTGIGRFVYDGGGLYHYRNGRNQSFLLGGDNRLRGYPSGQFMGHHLVTSNLEFRTRSIKLLEIMLGLVGFYDVGHAFDARMQPKHSVGIGGRATFPQFQRTAARLDLAFPLTRPTSDINEHWGSWAVYLTLEGQALPVPSIQPGTTRTPLLEHLAQMDSSATN